MGRLKKSRWEPNVVSPSKLRSPTRYAISDDYRDRDFVTWNKYESDLTEQEIDSYLQSTAHMQKDVALEILRDCDHELKPALDKCNDYALIDDLTPLEKKILLAAAPIPCLSLGVMRVEESLAAEKHVLNMLPHIKPPFIRNFFNQVGRDGCVPPGGLVPKIGQILEPCHSFLRKLNLITEDSDSPLYEKIGRMILRSAVITPDMDTKYIAMVGYGVTRSGEEANVSNLGKEQRDPLEIDMNWKPNANRARVDVRYGTLGKRYQRSLFGTSTPNTKESKLFGMMISSDGQESGEDEEVDDQRSKPKDDHDHWIDTVWMEKLRNPSGRRAVKQSESSFAKPSATIFGTKNKRETNYKEKKMVQPSTKMSGTTIHHHNTAAVKQATMSGSKISSDGQESGEDDEEDVQRSKGLRETDADDSEIKKRKRKRGARHKEKKMTQPKDDHDHWIDTVWMEKLQNPSGRRAVKQSESSFAKPSATMFGTSNKRQTHFKEKKMAQPTRAKYDDDDDEDVDDDEWLLTIRYPAGRRPEKVLTDTFAKSSTKMTNRHHNTVAVKVEPKVEKWTAVVKDANAANCESAMEEEDSDEE